MAGAIWLPLADGRGAPAFVAASVLALAVVLGIIWRSRAHTARRWKAALDAYAVREIARARRSKLAMKGLHFGIVVPIVLALAGGGWAGDNAPKNKTGLQVGTRAPAFTLKDQNGKERTLDRFLKKGKVALVFYRSAAW